MTSYRNREEKMTWMVGQFKSVFEHINSVLDIGCYEKYLERHIPERVKYVGVDIYGRPDIHLDLDKKENLPFKDDSFDLVVCADVLEHLENIHFIFDELIRISNKYVLIALPNPLSGVFSYFLGRNYSELFEKQKKFGKYMKFYGLPLEEPKDRHRWFFNTEEAINFIRYRSKKNKWEILKIIYTINFQGNFKKLLKFIISGFNRKRTLNWFNGATWFLIKKL